MTIKIYLAGKVGIWLDQQPVIREENLRGKQGRLAFAYLVTEHRRAIPKDELASVIWPQEMAAAWETALSALMSRLRNHLLRGPLGAEGMSLSSGLGLYRLELPVSTWIDLEACASAIDEAEHRMRNNEPGQILGPASIVANIARRSFLPDCQGPWVGGQRNKLERMLVRALECHTRMWLSMGEPTLAVETANEAVSLDPYREGSYGLLMESLAASGNRSEGIRTYHTLRHLLSNDLGVDPSPEIERIYLQLIQ